MLGTVFRPDIERLAADQDSIIIIWYGFQDLGNVSDLEHLFIPHRPFFIPGNKLKIIIPMDAVSVLKFFR